MKIRSFAVYDLTKGAHAAFYMGLLEMIGQAPVVSENAGPEVEALKEAFAREEELFGRLRKSPLTERISSLDGLRDQLLLMLMGDIRRSRRLQDSRVVDAAERLFHFVRSFGRVVEYQYDRKSGDLRLICEGLQGEHAAEVEALGLVPLVEKLRLANEDFHQAMVERTETEAGFMKNEFGAARASTDMAYNRLVETVNALSVLAARAGENPYQEFVEWVNARIEYLKREEKV